MHAATAKEKCLKKFAKAKHIVPGQQEQRKREFIPRGGAHHRESSTLLRRAHHEPKIHRGFTKGMVIGEAKDLGGTQYQT